MKTAAGYADPRRLLAVALDAAAPAAEAESAGTLAIRFARSEGLSLHGFADAIAPTRQLPAPEPDPDEYPYCLTMPCGMHKGKSLGWIAENDWEYICWVATDFRNRPIRAAAQELVSRKGAR